MKKYIKANIDHSEDGKYQQLFADVVDKIIDHMTENGVIQAQEMAHLVPGYDPDWCAEEASYDDRYKQIVKLSSQLARLIAEDYFVNYH